MVRSSLGLDTVDGLIISISVLHLQWQPGNTQWCPLSRISPKPSTAGQPSGTDSPSISFPS
jgi:hypothetical protein